MITDKMVSLCKGCENRDTKTGWCEVKFCDTEFGYPHCNSYKMLEESTNVSAEQESAIDNKFSAEVEILSSCSSEELKDMIENYLNKGYYIQNSQVEFYCGRIEGVYVFVKEQSNG